MNREIKSQYEVRSFDLKDVRTETLADNQLVVSGVAIVFNSLSVDMGGWREIIRPGAFDRSINDGHTIKALIDHDSGRPCGNTKKGTLQLSLKEDGLHFTLLLSNTTEARDLYTNIQDENFDKCSFGFTVITRELRDDVDALPVIEVTEADLWEISVVSFPAYQATEVTVRSVEAFREAAAKAAEPPVETKLETPNLNHAKRILEILEIEA